MSTEIASDHILGHRAKGVALVLTAGIFWSFAGLAVRLIEHANEWQILFFRSTTLVTFLTSYLLVARQGRIISSFRNNGITGMCAGLALSLAFCTWIHALTNTTVANALFLLSTAPFMAAIVGWWILKERVSASMILFMLLAVLGVAVMVAEAYQIGTLLGTTMGLLSAAGFAVFAVLLRKGRKSDLVPSVLWAGLFASVISGLTIVALDSEFGITSRDWLLCASMGVFQVGIGLVIFTHGAKYLPAAEITLLSLTEIVLGPIWVWLVIREFPGTLTLIGGAVVLTAIAGQAVVTLLRRT